MEKDYVGKMVYSSMTKNAQKGLVENTPALLTFGCEIELRQFTIVPNIMPAGLDQDVIRQINIIEHDLFSIVLDASTFEFVSTPFAYTQEGCKKFISFVQHVEKTYDFFKQNKNWKEDGSSKSLYFTLADLCEFLHINLNNSIPYYTPTTQFKAIWKPDKPLEIVSEEHPVLLESNILAWPILTQITSSIPQNTVLPYFRQLITHDFLETGDDARLFKENVKAALKKSADAEGFWFYYCLNTLQNLRKRSDAERIEYPKRAFFVMPRNCFQSAEKEMEFLKKSELVEIKYHYSHEIEKTIQTTELLKSIESQNEILNKYCVDMEQRTKKYLLSGYGSDYITNNTINKNAQEHVSKLMDSIKETYAQRGLFSPPLETPSDGFLSAGIRTWPFYKSKTWLIEWRHYYTKTSLPRFFTLGEIYEKSERFLEFVFKPYNT